MLKFFNDYYFKRWQCTKCENETDIFIDKQFTDYWNVCSFLKIWMQNLHKYKMEEKGEKKKAFYINYELKIKGKIP